MNFKSLYVSFFVLCFSLYGFSQSYNMVSNMTKSIYSCSGTLYDNGGPSGIYANSSTDDFIIYPDAPNKVIQVRLDSKSIDDTPGAQDQLLYISGVEYMSGTSTYTLFMDSGFGTGDGIWKTSKQTDGAVALRFLADATKNAGGFKLSYQCIAKTTTQPSSYSKTITVCSTVITDGGFTKNYSPNENGALVITPSTEGKKMKLQFDSLNIASADTLYIYDGNSTSSSILRKISGNVLPTAVYASLTNTSGILTLRFSTNASTEASGFHIKASCSDGEPPKVVGTTIPTTGNQVIKTCVDTIYDDGGAAGNYAKNSDGSLTIYPSDSTLSVKLVFEDLNLNTFDNVYIYNGIGTTYPLLYNGYGTSVPTNSYLATNAKGALTIRLSSGSTEPLRGVKIISSCVTPQFNMPLTSVLNITSCNAVLYDNGGSDKSYNVNSNGTVVIKPNTPDSKSVITIKSLSTEAKYDVLSVYSGSGLDTLLLDKLSGVKTNLFYTSQNINGSLTLKFKSDNSFTSSGFVINIGCESLLANVEENVIQLVETVFPNPTNDVLNFNFSSVVSKIEILNLTGSLVKSIKGLSQNANIDISDLEKGVYVIHVHTDIIKTFKIIKN